MPVTATCAGLTTVTCTESNVPDGTWQYTDTPTYGLNWVGAESAQSAPVVVDTTAPMVPAPSVVAGYVTVLSVPVGLGAATDTGGSGVNTSPVMVLRTSAALSSGTCATFSSFTPVPLTGGNDTSVLSGFCYRYQQRASDNVGNTATSSTSDTVKVDATSPTGPTFTFSALTSAYWPGSGTTVYFRGGSSGSFTVTPSATDSESAISGYAYPDLGSGWSRAGGAYSFTGSAGTGTGVINAANGAGSIAGTPLTARSDPDGPTGGALLVNGVPATAGGSTSYITAGATLALSGRTDFSEPLSATRSGLASSTLTLRSAALTNNACGTFGAPTIITGTSAPVTADSCYLLTLSGTDNVGNSSSLSSTVKVDTSAPSTPTLSFSSLTNARATGARVYFRSDAPSGGLTVTATSTDPQSGIGGWTFPDLGTGWAVTGSAESRTYTWSAPTPATSSGSLTVSATNGAGLLSPASAPFTMVPDATRRQVARSRSTAQWPPQVARRATRHRARRWPRRFAPSSSRRRPDAVRPEQSTLTVRSAPLTNNTAAPTGCRRRSLEQGQRPQRRAPATCSRSPEPTMSETPPPEAPP